MKNRFMRAVLLFTTSLLQAPLKVTKFNQVVQVNNKPCDAILYPELEVVKVVDELTKKFPKHAILFPRVDRLTHSKLVASLEKNGFLLVPTRPAHIYDPATPYMRRSHTKRDFSLLKKTACTFVSHDELTKEDLYRCHELYYKLFVEKHGRESPQLTSNYFLESHKNRWYTFFGLRNPDGTLDAFFCYEKLQGVMACGPLGYDTSKEQSLGLYRQLFAHSLKVAKEENLIFNFGGGNEQFKSARGSTRVIGYTAVYCDHLPLWRSLPWIFFGKLMRKTTENILNKQTF